MNDVTGRASVGSEISGRERYVRFVNRTEQVIDVIWVDYTGCFVRYTSLTSGQFIDVNTYKRHRWIAVDSETKDALLLNGVYRYEPEFPKTVRERMRAHCDQLPAKVRILVNITVPMYSLYFRTLMTVRDRLQSEEDVDKLELSWIVKEHLKSVVKMKLKRGVLMPFGAGQL